MDRLSGVQEPPRLVVTTGSQTRLNQYQQDPKPTKISSETRARWAMLKALAGVSDENRDTVEAQAIPEPENGVSSGLNDRNATGTVRSNRSADKPVHKAHYHSGADGDIFLGAEDRNFNPSAIQDQNGGRPTFKAPSIDLSRVGSQQPAHEARINSHIEEAASNDYLEPGLKGLEEVQREDNGSRTREKPPATESLRTGRHDIRETRPSSGDSSRRTTKQTLEMR